MALTCTMALRKPLSLLLALLCPVALAAAGGACTQAASREMEPSTENLLLQVQGAALLKLEVGRADGGNPGEAYGGYTGEASACDFDQPSGTPYFWDPKCTTDYYLEGCWADGKSASCRICGDDPYTGTPCPSDATYPETSSTTPSTSSPSPMPSTPMAPTTPTSPTTMAPSTMTVTTSASALPSTTAAPPSTTSASTLPPTTEAPSTTTSGSTSPPPTTEASTTSAPTSPPTTTAPPMTTSSPSMPSTTEMTTMPPTTEMSTTPPTTKMSTTPASPSTSTTTKDPMATTTKDPVATTQPPATTTKDPSVTTHAPGTTTAPGQSPRTCKLPADKRPRFFWDESCEMGMLGCLADGENVECRYCGEGDYSSIPCLGVDPAALPPSSTRPPTPPGERKCTFPNPPLIGYFFDENCEMGKLGCNADGLHVGCRFCGAGDWINITCPNATGVDADPTSGGGKGPNPTPGGPNAGGPNATGGDAGPNATDGDAGPKPGPNPAPNRTGGCTFMNEPLIDYYFDESCEMGMIGCSADGLNVGCRFCGAGAYINITCPEDAMPGMCTFPDGQDHPYFWDPKCANGKLGCWADGIHAECRFCGEGEYSTVPCKE